MKSSYQIKWAIVKAENNGVITLKDKKLFDSSLNFNKTKYEKSISFFGNIDEKLKNVQGKLSKKMKLLFITDAQFGKMKKTFDKGWWEAAMEVATEKQKNEIITIQ